MNTRRMALSLLALSALAAACVDDPDPSRSEPWVHEPPGAPGSAELTEAFLDSGAGFGLIVDPSSGEVAVLERLDRAVNSADFRQLGASCLDCGGANAACTGPAGLSRQIEVALVREQGAGPVDVMYSATRNWSPTGVDCNGAACPAPDVDASGGPADLDVVLRGTLGSCAAFAVYFDTDGP